MFSEQLIQNATEAYIIAYNAAMDKTRNPGMATNIAASVTMSYMAVFKDEIEKQQNTTNFLATLFSAVTEQNSKASNRQEGEEDKNG